MSSKNVFESRRVTVEDLKASKRQKELEYSREKEKQITNVPDLSVLKKENDYG